MKLRTTLIFAIMAAFWMSASAQDEIQFGIGKAKSDSSLSKDVKSLLTNKVSQILNRNSAAAGGNFGAFVVTPTLNMTNESTTSGLARNVRVVTGELTLTAMNRDDKSEYYSVTVPLKATDPTGSGEPMQLLVKSIKPTDAAYVRFIRTARENISKSLEKDCEEIVARAKGIYASGKIEDAMSLLMAIPTSSSCNEEVLELLAGMGAQKAKKEQEMADNGNVSKSGSGGKRDSNEGVRKGKPMDDGNNGTDSGDDNDSDYSDDDEKASQNDMKIFISEPEWEMKADSFEWVETNRNVVCNIRVRNTYTNADNVHISSAKAITCDGEQYDNISVDKDIYRDFPQDVWIKIQFFIKDIRKDPGCLARFTFKLNSRIIFEINNVDIQ